MNLPFLYMMDVTMLFRLVFLFSNNRLSKKQWAGMILPQLVALSIFEPGPDLWVLSCITGFVNILAIFGDSRFKQSDFFRFVILLMWAIVFSIFFSPGIDLRFNPWLMNQISVWKNYSSITVLVKQFGLHKLSLLLFGVLLVSNEVNFLIRSSFHVFGLLSTRENQKGAKYLVKPIDLKELNAGRIIGILERIIMYSMIITGSAGSIGFVLAAKAFTRFRELDERSFAEYILVGTLFSTLYAVLLAFFIKTVIF